MSFDTVLAELQEAGIRLPLATALGTALALRPRRRGTPPRQAAVVQTQIVLASVGAIVMLVVGSNLARAFGIVGVASLNTDDSLRVFNGRTKYNEWLFIAGQLRFVGPMPGPRLPQGNISPSPGGNPATRPGPGMRQQDK